MNIMASQIENIISTSTIWDNHSCLPLRPEDTSFLPQLQRYIDAGFSIVCLNIGYWKNSFKQHLDMASSFINWINDNSDRFALLTSFTSLEEALSDNRLVIFFDAEGTNVICHDLERLQILYDIGVRWMSLAYNEANAVTGGCMAGQDKGLTSFGKDVITEMNRIGIMVCCSHVGYKSALEVMEYSDKPVIFSHSNCHELWSHPRNIPDTLIEACAATGGVIGINAVGPFLQNSGAEAENMVRHIDYIIQRVGPDYATLGLDYVFDKEELLFYLKNNQNIFPNNDGTRTDFPILGPECLPDIIQGLLNLGYPNDTIQKILGGNLIRVAHKVWKKN